MALKVDDASNTDQLYSYLTDLLVNEGFEVIGRRDEMIEMLSRGSVPGGANDYIITLLQREYSYVNESRNLRVVVTDYSATPPDPSKLRYDAPFDEFLEISVYESRPGGFSPDGHAFFWHVAENLQARYPNHVVVVVNPPATDQAEYWRETISGVISGIVAWCVVLVISLALVGTVIYFVVERLPLRRTGKQAIFAVVCTWVVTPVPIWATILFVPGPNILLFPWTEMAYYYERFGGLLIGSFVGTFVVCLFIARRGYGGAWSTSARSGEA